MKIVRGRYPPISSSYSKDLRQCVDVCRDAPFQPSLPAIRRAAARLTRGRRPHPHLQDLLKMSLRLAPWLEAELLADCLEVHDLA